MRSAPSALLLAAVTHGACARPPVAPPPAPPRIAIVVAEGDARGVRLVAVDERGDRQLELVQPAATLARDTSPAISPDGRWLAFASSRARPVDETSLWLAPLAPEAAPIPLTDGAGAVIDAQPAWTPDGAGLVWASTRGGHGFDLWRAEVDRGGGRPVLRDARALTTAPGHEITPSIARDGAIVYAAVRARDDGGVTSRLEELAPDGAVRTLSEGPSDSAPAVSPDGTQIAFARPVARVVPGAGSAAGGPLVDSELWLVPRAGGAPRVLVDLPLTDESGPVWSRDGRYVLATSVLRGADGRVVFSSVVAIDTRESPPVARILADRAGPIARLTPAVSGAPLAAAALAANAEYLPELARIMATPMVEQKRRAGAAAP